MNLVDQFNVDVRDLEVTINNSLDQVSMNTACEKFRKLGGAGIETHGHIKLVYGAIDTAKNDGTYQELGLHGDADQIESARRKICEITREVKAQTESDGG